jgi:alkaline phosphatase
MRVPSSLRSHLAVGLALAACGDAQGGDDDDGSTSTAPATTIVPETDDDAASGGSTEPSDDDDATTTVDSSGGDTSSGDPRPRVILMIGDGMGRGQLHTASVYAHGEPGALFMQTLPQRGEIVTGSRSGLTDSAAAATAMASGTKTTNGRIGMDEDAQPLVSIVEDAKARGLATGVVTTAYLPHATPGGFTAHRETRHDLVGIADDQALVVQPDVMLGGGALYYLPEGRDSVRTDGGLLAPLERDGYAIVTTAEELGALRADADRIVGLFASEHMDYVVDRAADTTQPMLVDMTLAALDVLERDPDGFLLVVEGARIDMASHDNDIERAITETLAFDDAIEAVAGWAAEHEDVTLVVTADHECGGLEPDPSASEGVLPDVTWRWDQHTNARVDVFAQGPGTEVFAGEVRDHAWVHAVLASRVAGDELAPPVEQFAPDGHLAELDWDAATQVLESSYGAGHNQMDALWLDADATGLAIGIEGLFKRDRNTVVVLVDADFGAATGYDGLLGNLSDHDGRIDDTLANVAVVPSGIAGFGADFALASFGTLEARREDLLPDAGLRGLHAPIGEPFDLAWLEVGLDFGEGVRIPQGSSGIAVPGEGFEAFVPWRVLFPDLDGGVPAGTRIAVVAVLVNDDGTDISNQTLPPLPADAEPPGASPLALPGVVELPVDVDEDGIADGDTAPIVHVR